MIQGDVTDKAKLSLFLVQCQCRGPRGAMWVYILFHVLFITEVLLNRCCFAKGSVCLGFNPTLKLVENLRFNIFVLQFLARWSIIVD
jgi:hypothetical protein